MGKLLAGGVLALGLVLGPVAATAHHSPVAVFDMASRKNFTGTLKKVNWVNPHIFLEVEVPEGGKTTTWAFESMPPSWFTRAGVRKRDFDVRVGQTVTVRAMVARNGNPFGYLRIINFTDGAKIQLLRDDEQAPDR